MRGYLFFLRRGSDACHDAADFCHGPGKWPVTEWWRGFDDQQLEALIAEALAGLPDLSCARARLGQARAVAQYDAAMRRPRGSGEARVSAGKQSYNDGIPPQFVPRGYNDRASVGLTLAYDPDLEGGASKRALTALSEGYRGGVAGRKHFHRVCRRRKLCGWSEHLVGDM